MVGCGVRSRGDMNKGFEDVVNSYNQQSEAEILMAFLGMGKILLLHYKALLDVGFDKWAALEFTKVFQKHILSMNQAQSKGEE